MKIELSPIGVIHSCYKDRFGVPRQPGLIEEAQASIEIYKHCQPEFSLQGLEKFSHIWVMFYFHQAQQKRFHAKVHPPRLQGESVGVFATRSPHRPNPLGLSLVRIAKVTSSTIEIMGGDFLDQTPVLDIKPYHVEVESVPDAKKGWIGELVTAEESMTVHWDEEARMKAQRWATATKRPHLLALIEKTAALDPRPLVYKNAPNAYQMTHAFRLYEGDVKFVFESANSARITKIEVD